MIRHVDHPAIQPRREQPLRPALITGMDLSTRQIEMTIQ